MSNCRNSCPLKLLALLSVSACISAPTAGCTPPPPPPASACLALDQWWPSDQGWDGLTLSDKTGLATHNCTLERVCPHLQRGEPC